MKKNQVNLVLTLDERQFSSKAAQRSLPPVRQKRLQNGRGEFQQALLLHRGSFLRKFGRGVEVQHHFRAEDLQLLGTASSR